MLDQLHSESRRLLEEASEYRNIQKGHELFREGKNPVSVYFLLKGKMKLYTTDAQGREQIVHLAAPGDLMAYRAILGGDSLSCSASALEDSEVMIIPKATFLEVLERDSAFSHAVIRLLTNELRHAEHHLAGLARKPVRERIAEVLLVLADKFGFESDGQTLAISLTREEIAGLVGTATETVIRLLHAMEDEGVLAIHGRQLRLLDRNALRKH